MGTEPAFAKLTRKKTTVTASAEALPPMNWYLHNQQGEEKSTQHGHFCWALFPFSLQQHRDTGSGWFFSPQCCEMVCSTVLYLPVVCQSDLPWWNIAPGKVRSLQEGENCCSWLSQSAAEENTDTILLLAKIKAEHTSNGNSPPGTSHSMWLGAGPLVVELLLWLPRAEKPNWKYRVQGCLCCSKHKHLTLGKSDGPLQEFSNLSQEEGRLGIPNAKSEMTWPSGRAPPWLEVRTGCQLHRQA